MDEADHVVAHRRTVDTIHKTTCLKSGILGLEGGREGGREGEKKELLRYHLLHVVNSEVQRFNGKPNVVPFC